MFLKVKPSDLIKDKDIKFGTSGLRGLVSDFSDLIVTAYTVSFILHLQHQGFKFKKVAIANDLRSSSPRFINAVIHGIKQCNLIPIYAGAIPTPALVYYGVQNNVPTIMVTGSHIPDNRNGLKFTSPLGEITKEDERGISKTFLHLDLAGFTKRGSLKVKEHVRKDNKILVSYKNRYVNVLPDKVFSGLKLGLYEHSAVGREFYKDLFETLGAEVIPFGKTYSFIPVDTEDLRVEDSYVVRGWCSMSQVHCVISSDGDSDRPLIFDELGNQIKGDFLGLLASKVLKSSIVVTPITSTSAIEKSQWFDKVVRTKIGSPYVLEAMYEEKESNVIGFEANGGMMHIQPLDFLLGRLAPLPTRDSTIVHICFLIGLLGNKIPASALKEIVPQRVVSSSLIKNVNVNKTLALLKTLEKNEAAERLFNVVIVECNLIDGIRLTLDSGDILHLRLSGNAPELRCYCESETELKAELLLKNSLSVLKEFNISA